jgi:hypothetical protein
VWRKPHPVRCRYSDRRLAAWLEALPESLRDTATAGGASGDHRSGPRGTRRDRATTWLRQRLTLQWSRTDARLTRLCGVMPFRSTCLRRRAGCHFYFARGVTFLSCADSDAGRAGGTQSNDHQLTAFTLGAPTPIFLLTLALGRAWTDGARRKYLGRTSSLRSRCDASKAGEPRTPVALRQSTD